MTTTQIKKERPANLQVHPCNDIGLIIEKNCRLSEIKFYVENGSVMFWASVHDSDGAEVEALQYLPPEVAMRFAKAMEACALEAFKTNTNYKY